MTYLRQLTWSHDDSQCSPQMVLAVLRNLNICVWFFVFCLWSDQSEFMALFMLCNLLIGSGFIF
jgi:hypothetical protein